VGALHDHARRHGRPDAEQRTREAAAIDVALGLLAVLALTLATAFFVAGEFALVAADRPKIERLAQSGDKRAKSATAALETLSFQLSGAQLGITVTSLTVGFIAEATIAKALDPLILLTGLSATTVRGISIALALAIATALQMVVGELVPKNVALARPIRLALTMSTPLRLWNSLMRPVIVFLNGGANLAVRLVGLEPHDELRSVRSLEEIEVLIRSSRRQGALPEEEFSLLRRALGFAGKTAADVLVPRLSVVALDRSASLADMATLAMDTGHSRFPVFGRDVDDIVGVAYVNDIHRVPPEARADTTVSGIVREALVVPESRTLESLMLEMRRQRKQLAIIIDEYGATAGIVTIEDLVEEIVGDIEDEYDPAASALLTASPEGVHVLSGMLHPDEVEELTGWRIPEGDYETLAGFLLTLFDRIPQPGEHTSFDGCELKVVEMDDKRISRVLLILPSRQTVEGDGS
jgi:CBS domain containing-hemolysin-like protein